MNENDTNESEAGFFRTVATDDGVQRAVAGVVVAAVVAGAKYMLFGSK